MEVQVLLPQSSRRNYRKYSIAYRGILEDHKAVVAPEEVQVQG